MIPKVPWFLICVAGGMQQSLPALYPFETHAQKLNQTLVFSLVYGGPHANLEGC